MAPRTALAPQLLAVAGVLLVAAASPAAAGGGLRGARREAAAAEAAGAAPAREQLPAEAPRGPEALNGFSSPEQLAAGNVTAQMSLASRSVAKALHLGRASSRQLQTILRVAGKCFDRHPVDTANLGQLQFTLGAATGCVQRRLARKWGQRPVLDVSGSASCGQCNGYGKGATVIEVVTDSGSWMFVLRLQRQGAHRPKPPASTATALQQGDATDSQLSDILYAARECFDAHPVDTSNLGQLQGSLGAAVACVQKRCESRWGWKPRVSNTGSHSCGRCEGYGLGATVVAVDTSAGDWMFVMRLKA